MDRVVRWATVHGIAKSQTQLKQLSMHACIMSILSFFFFVVVVLVLALIIARLKVLGDNLTVV